MYKYIKIKGNITMKYAKFDNCNSKGDEKTILDSKSQNDKEIQVCSILLKFKQNKCDRKFSNTFCKTIYCQFFLQYLLAYAINWYWRNVNEINLRLWTYWPTVTHQSAETDAKPVGDPKDTILEFYVGIISTADTDNFIAMCKH